MRIIAAYLLAVLGGNSHPNEADLLKILGSVGVEANGGEIIQFLSEVNQSGKSVEELISEGRRKLMNAQAPSASASTCSLPEIHYDVAPNVDIMDDGDGCEDVEINLFD